MNPSVFPTGADRMARGTSLDRPIIGGKNLLAFWCGSKPCSWCRYASLRALVDRCHSQQPHQPWLHFRPRSLHFLPAQRELRSENSVAAHEQVFHPRDGRLRRTVIIATERKSNVRGHIYTACRCTAYKGYRSGIGYIGLVCTAEEDRSTPARRRDFDWDGPARRQKHCFLGVI
jgi:hypothetical protein